MRNHFDRQLDHMNEELSAMGALCESAIANAAKGILEDNEDACRTTLDLDAEIDRKESDIERICLQLLLRQQPVARDLRLISSALKMITDMERIGDQSSDIAEIAMLHPVTDVTNLVPIKEMAAATIRMVTESVDSFIRRDLKLARAVVAYDDVVDDLFAKVRDDLIGVIGRHPEKGEDAVDLLMVAKYFERIGDHATNIAEWVIFSITATHDPKAGK